MKYLSLVTAVFLVLGIVTAGLAADDPSIKGQMRTGIQAAMSEHVKYNSVDGRYAIYDAT